MNKRQKTDSLNSLFPSKNTNLCGVKKFVYPSISRSPIIFNNDQIIYGYGSALVFFCLKEKKYIKKIEEHNNAIRSLDASKNKKYFLTTGDDKVIIIYDENWSIIQKIIHKKKIVKAYFLKHEKEKTNKFEILFIDKYGDIYVCDLHILQKTSSLTVEENKTSMDNESMSEDKITTTLKYLYDSLDGVREKDDDLFFMKDFEHTYNRHTNDNMLNSDNSMKSDTETANIDNSDMLILNNTKQMDHVKENLEKLYTDCFENKKLLYPILTCNSIVTCLYYDKKMLIIGDRDEKIRIIKNNKMNKIYNFYLNHKLFITSIVLINENIFCSSGADCYLYLWNIKTKEVIDYIYMDYNFLSTIVDLKAIFSISNNIEKYSYIISNLSFNESAFSIFATIEIMNGILIIPLIKNQDSGHISINKHKIVFHSLKQHILSFLVLRNMIYNIIVFVEKEKGHLHQLKLNDDNSLDDEEATFDHSFFEDKSESNIGLLNYWKHTTIEDL